MKFKIVVCGILSWFFLMCTPLHAEKQFPVWDEGVFGEIYKRHGEKAAARLRDVYQFMIVHLNDPVEQQLEAVNDYMNDLTWIADSDLWKQPDYWATPFETITTFGGDCEDIAIAKYAVLVMMGIPDDHMGFAHVVTTQNEHHMILVYQASEKEPAFILDNQNPDVKKAKERKDLIAVYVFQNNGKIFIIKDEGDAKRTVKATKENQRLQKWLTAKERSKSNTESFVAFNNGQSLIPDWARIDD